jgi:hypothetical protein
MPLTLSPAAGDAVTAPAWRINVLLPDTGTTITVNGSYQPASLGGNPPGIQPPLNFSGTITSPGVPGSGNNYLLVEVNLSTGALTAKTSASAMPSVDSGNAIIFTQIIASTASAAISLQGNLTFPWL